MLIENELPTKHQQPVEVMNYWIQEVRRVANKSYTEYIMGTRETFILNNEEILETYQKSMDHYVGDILGSLVEKEMVNVSVNESGELVYNLSDKGEGYVKDDMRKTLNGTLQPTKKRGRPKKH